MTDDTTDPPQESAMQHRATDRGPIHVGREIPLPWLIGAAGAVVAQAALIWLGQEKQADAIGRMTTTIAEQTKQIQSLSVQIGDKNLKDVEHDLKLADIERRLGFVESRKP